MKKRKDKDPLIVNVLATLIAIPFTGFVLLLIFFYGAIFAIATYQVVSHAITYFVDVRTFIGVMAIGAVAMAGHAIFDWCKARQLRVAAKGICPFCKKRDMIMRIPVDGTYDPPEIHVVCRNCHQEIIRGPYCPMCLLPLHGRLVFPVVDGDYANDDNPGPKYYVCSRGHDFESWRELIKYFRRTKDIE